MKSVSVQIEKHGFGIGRHVNAQIMQLVSFHSASYVTEPREFESAAQVYSSVEAQACRSV
jgi:hypothetical protein